MPIEAAQLQYDGFWQEVIEPGGNDRRIGARSLQPIDDGNRILA
jgi:hypothetical protein